MNRVRSSAAACLALAVVLSGCDLLSVSCDDYAEYGVGLTVRSVGGGDITTSRITVSATDGSYRDEFTLDQEYTGTPFFGLATERVGRYHIEVTAEGYEPWEFGPVHVFADECHVERASIIVELVAIGP